MSDSAKSSCRVCGGTFAKYHRVDEFTYGRCSRCGVLEKILSESEYLSLPVTYDPGEALGTLGDSELRKFLEIEKKKALLTPLIAKVRAQVGPEVKLKLLDIGCGMGGYLIAAQEMGLGAAGIEPSESHSRIGRERFKQDIATQYFSRDPARNEAYHIIMLSHVIEHIHAQKKFLEDVYAALAPGGVIFIATPNAASTIARLSGSNWVMLKPVDHVGLLTPAALPRLLPAGAKSVTWTDEYRWEPFIALGSGFRNAVRARLAKRRAAAGATASGAQPPAVPRNSFRTTTNRLGAAKFLRLTATVLSAPIYFFDKERDRAACLVCEIHKPRNS